MRRANWKRPQSEWLRPRDLGLALSLLRPFDSFLVVNPDVKQMLVCAKIIRERHKAGPDRWAWAWQEGGIRVWRIR